MKYVFLYFNFIMGDLLNIIKYIFGWLIKYTFVVSCHRALGKFGALTGYHWGITRKRAILGWESGVND